MPGPHLPDGCTGGGRHGARGRCQVLLIEGGPSGSDLDGGRLPLLVLRWLPGARSARRLESFPPALLFNLLALFITLSLLQCTTCFFSELSVVGV